jgi:hypothetical protein
MIKAMLIVASLGINTEMPDMDSCLKARTAIMKQDPAIKSLCVPKGDETANVKTMIQEFFKNIVRLQEIKENSPKFKSCMAELLDMKEICSTGATINCQPYYDQRSKCLSGEK